SERASPKEPTIISTDRTGASRSPATSRSRNANEYLNVQPNRMRIRGIPNTPARHDNASTALSTTVVSSAAGRRGINRKRVSCEEDAMREARYGRAEDHTGGRPA